jgi:hypothetical protein
MIHNQQPTTTLNTECPQHLQPTKSAPGQNLRVILLDGCWKLHDTFIKGYRGSAYLDLLHEPIFKGNVMEVVILSQPHIGQWVKCEIDLIENPGVPSGDSNHPSTRGTTQPSFMPMGEERERALFADVPSTYTIYVQETTMYNNAVGFSGSLAPRIQRNHLRFPRYSLSHERSDLSSLAIRERLWGRK